MSRSANLPGEDLVDSPSATRQVSTLPRKMGGLGGTLGRSAQAPLPPRRDPKTTLSIGRARAKSLVGGLGKFFHLFRNRNKFLFICSNIRRR